jgi:DNA-binding helix-hairpin-helix protein with protein kinase domain
VFAPGQVVQLAASRTSARVGALLGEGGQGSVHAATVDGSPEQYALKWYFPGFATEQQWNALRALITRGSPSPAFLWPLDLVTAPGTPGFGYLMPLRPDGFTGMVDLVRGQVDTGFRRLAITGRDLAHSFLLLHSEGLCYRDISFGNVFLRPETGAVLICDVDNVGVDGATGSTVRGTPYFMAPEIVRGEAMPSTGTDLFSLAVLLFYAFLLGHPLEGARALSHQVWDVDAMTDAFGAHPTFVFDPADDGNRPVPGASVEQDNMLACWPVVPSFLRTLFVRAFTGGLAADGDRVRESEWRKAMVRLHDSVVFCASCGRENLADVDDDGTPVAAVAAVGGQRCWSCAAPLPLPPRLVLASHPVVLAHDTVLHGYHLASRYDFAVPAAEITRHPADPGLWGLRNLTAGPWTAREPSGSEWQIAPGRAVALTDGITLAFGSGATGIVRT